ncbi:ATP-binding protein [Dysosmobacter sp.]
MAASFGRLQNHTLELREGLNIIEAPNETGKSTWCAFLAAMFYGINSRERDRAGYIADKNRYAPWAGASMAGRIDLFHNGEELTLLRATRRQTAPMGEFKAIYTGTGDPVPGLNGTSCGETLLGVSREVFERSALIRQAGISISQDAGLERRIAALITSGEEDISYTEASSLLKKQLNRRRHNKTGQLPQLESQLEEAARQLEQLRQLESQRLQLQTNAQALSEKEDMLSQALVRLEQWELHQRRRQLDQAECTAQASQQRLDTLRRQLEEERVPENETIGRLRGAIVNLETVRKAVDKARAERDKALKALLRAEAAVAKSPFAGETPEGARKAAAALPVMRPRAWWLPVTAPLLFAGLFYFFNRFSGRTTPPLWALAAMGGLGFICGLFDMLLKSSSDRKKRAAYLAAHGADTPESLSALADAYCKLAEARDAAQAEVNAKSATADALYASLTSNEQAILLEVRRFAPSAFEIAAADQLLRSCALRRKELGEADAAAREAALRRDLLRQQLSDLPEETGPAPSQQPPGDREQLSRQLEEVRSQRAAASAAAERLTGQIHALGDGVLLETSTQELTERRVQLEEEYQAIALALQTLDTANTALQTRFSPALGRRAAEIFRELTGGRYQGVILDRSFHLSAEPAGDTVYRDAALLSAGTADQLYLAVRLAICDLVLPAETSVPLILDDALANFDDERCAAALRYCRQEAQRRQILLFTCHSREAEFFAGDREVFIQRLTQTPQQV